MRFRRNFEYLLTDDTFVYYYKRDTDETVSVRRDSKKAVLGTFFLQLYLVIFTIMIYAVIVFQDNTQVRSSMNVPLLLLVNTVVPVVIVICSISASNIFYDCVCIAANPELCNEVDFKRALKELNILTPIYVVPMVLGWALIVYILVQVCNGSVEFVYLYMPCALIALLYVEKIVDSFASRKLIKRLQETQVHELEN